MKRQMKRRLVKILKCEKGEAIIESVISLIVLTVLMISITTMILSALKITGYSIESAAAAQQSVNYMVLEGSLILEGSVSSDDVVQEAGEIRFQSADGVIDTVSHDIDVFTNESGIISFVPLVPQVTE